MRKNLFLVLLPVFFLFISCSSHQSVNESVTNTAVEEQKEQQLPEIFVLGEGDEIAISVWRSEELNRAATIDLAGNIYMPLVGEIKAAGMSIPELRKEITTKLSTYYIDPQVDINIVGVRSQNFHVFGEVRSAGSYGLNRKMLVWDAIAGAGGFTQDANRERVLLIRKKDEVVNISVSDMLITDSKDIMIENRYLQNNDILYVPPLAIASVERFMIRLYNIVRPILDIERTIIFAENVQAILDGTSDNTVIFAPQ